MRANSVRQVVKSTMDILTFGKHKGEHVWEVLQVDPQYILWLDEQEIVEFPDDVIIDAEEMEAELTDRADIWFNGVDDWGSME